VFFSFSPLLFPALLANILQIDAANDVFQASRIAEQRRPFCVIDSGRGEISARERSVMVEPIELAAEVVAAYISNNRVPKGDLPDLILAVHSALSRLGTDSPHVELQVEAKPPAVPVRKSITADYLICLEDGKKFKSLRRHLGALGLTPEQYRVKWKLPSDYPMVAPNYAAHRSALARKLGLGQKRKAG
jgi:predicted transcriptional regulator